MPHTAPGFCLLHVEDDPILIDLVRTAFNKFGFAGEMVAAGSVQKALELLGEKERARKSFNLILTDISLPDGTGLQLIRELRLRPYWRLTPIIVLSSEIDPETIDGSYALGANCYMPKFSIKKGVIASLKSLYECWMESATLPETPQTSRVHLMLSRSIALRSRTADMFMGIARVFESEPEESGFWLTRAMTEANLANLVAFIRDRHGKIEMPADLLNRGHDMQDRVRTILMDIEKKIRKFSAKKPDEVYRSVLDTLEAIDVTIVNESLSYFFLKEPLAAETLKSRARAQRDEVAHHIRSRTSDQTLRERAAVLV